MVIVYQILGIFYGCMGYIPLWDSTLHPIFLISRYNVVFFTLQKYSKASSWYAN